MPRRARRSGAMHVVTNTIRRGDREYAAHLLRRSYREGGKVKKETLANLSHLPEEVIELIRGALRGAALLSRPRRRSRSSARCRHGHVQAALAMARRLELARLLDRAPSRERALCAGDDLPAAARPGSKLATARARFAQSTLAAGARRSRTPTRTSSTRRWTGCSSGRRGSRRGSRAATSARATLVLYDVSSSYFEGRSCPLAQLGYSRDGRRGTLQIVYGLLCDRAGPAGRGRGVRGRRCTTTRRCRPRSTSSRRASA